MVSAAESADVPGPVRQAATELLPAARDAFVSGLSLTMTIAAAVTAVGALLVFGRGRRSDERPALETGAGTGTGAEVDAAVGARAEVGVGTGVGSHGAGRPGHDGDGPDDVELVGGR